MDQIRIRVHKTEEIRSVDEAWLRLVDFVDEHPYSTITIEFRDGVPFMAEKTVEKHKFS